MAEIPVSEHLRARKRQIQDAWTNAVISELPSLKELDEPSLIDHVPEFLDGLAAWIEGDTSRASRGFIALADGHALQRLAKGIDLTTLTREYALLRTAILRELVELSDGEQVAESLVRINQGMDAAVHEAVLRYAQRRDQIRDRFIGILAHDLRSPLAAVLMGAVRVMAMSEGRDDTLYRTGVLINRSAERMSRMVHDVIEFARGQLGGDIPIDLARGDLGEIARNAVEELRAGHPDRKIDVDTSGNLDGQWDRDRVMQLVSNLVSNALSYGVDPIVVRVSESADQPHGRTGLGLGLYIVRQIALGHGAHCSVTSTEDDGTTFVVEWPRTLESEVPRPGR
jgi:signal transduction histidine kinase